MSNARPGPLQGWSVWGVLGTVAAALCIAIGWRNYFVYGAAGTPVSLVESIAGEVPVWFGWLALVPAVTWMARRFPPLGPAAVRNGLVQLTAALACSAVVSIGIVAFRMMLPNTPSPANLDIGFWLFTQRVYTSVAFSFLFVYTTIVGVTLSAAYHMEQQERRVRESKLQALLAETQRDLLRAQIHPHFLFNTLHAISALMSSNVDAARQMMSRLSDLLRLALDENAEQEVSLDRELEFLRGYLDIQLIRFQDRLTVEYRIAPAAHDLLVPRIILQPLAENAIVHGLAPVERPVHIDIEARLDGGNLVISISDDGAGLPPNPVERIGILNSRARLQQLYGGSAALTLEASPDGGTVSQLVVPVHRVPVADT